MIGIIPVSISQSLVSEYFYPRGVDKEADFSRWPYPTPQFSQNGFWVFVSGSVVLSCFCILTEFFLSCSLSVRPTDRLFVFFLVKYIIGFIIWS